MELYIEPLLENFKTFLVKKFDTWKQCICYMLMGYCAHNRKEKQRKSVIKWLLKATKSQKMPFLCQWLLHKLSKYVSNIVRKIAKKNKEKVLSNGFWKPQSHKKFAKKCHFFTTGYYINWQNVIFLKIWAWDYFFLICTLFSI